MKTIYDNEMLLRSTLFPFVATIAQQFGDAQHHSVTLLLLYFFSISASQGLWMNNEIICVRANIYIHVVCMYYQLSLSLFYWIHIFFSLRLSGK